MLSVAVGWAALAFGPGVAGAGAAPASPAAVTATSKASLFVIQGVAAATTTLTLDGKVLRAGAPAKTVAGPVSVSAGRHTVTARPDDGSPPVQATVTVGAGASVDVVLHRQADATKAPVFTSYVNDLSPVTSGSARLTVAHTAAVGPADIRVRGKVLFANVANGEELSLTVPAGTYPVEIVPAASTGPVVLGPVDLPVTKGTLTRVFAIGVAATSSMDAVVQVLPIATRGSGTGMSRVDAGNGGQAQALIAAHESGGSRVSLASGWTPESVLAAGLLFTAALFALAVAVRTVPAVQRARAARLAPRREVPGAERRRRSFHP